MRKAMTVVMAAVLSVWVTGDLTAKAQRDTVQPVVQAAVNLRLATTTPARGFVKSATADGGTIYVAPRVAVSAHEMLSAESIAVRDGSDVSMALTDEAVKRLAGLAEKYNATQLAVYQGGTLLASGGLSIDSRASRITVTDLDSDAAGRVTRLISNDGTIPVGSAMLLVPSRTVIQPGEAVSVDVYLSNVQDLRTYQTSLMTRGGDAGSLTREDVVLNSTRADFVFAGQQKVDAVDQSGGRVGAVLFNGSVNVGDPAYIGTYTFRASADATGLFRIGVDIKDRASLLWSSSNQAINFSAGSATITVGARNNLRPSNK